ncbi:MAG: sigma-54 factor interaction protein [Gemmatimonadetes bacterium]|jgi:DNA-binding NtrC family response regulator|nr:sigma-54 factor interaction protein [Gemmatimonadota bacterium]
MVMTTTVATTRDLLPRVGGRACARPPTTTIPGLAELRLLALTDSFLAEWRSLAAANGLSLVAVDDPTLLEPRKGVLTVVSAGGDEAMLESALRQLPRGNSFLVAVGAQADHRLASAVVRAGADDYFALPEDHAAVAAWLRQGADRLRAEVDAAAFAEDERARFRFDGILGDSPALRAALDRVARVIPRPNVTVLITGETGTGKELLARAIHYNGPRRDSPFVDVNCAAIPENLLESELFGHEKGAFTGASSAKPGLLELADGGTLFLDEIGHLALVLQGKILRALEERVMRRVGGTRAIPFDVRLVAATHVDLSAAVKRGEFREDLYYRLNVVPVELPPLRARGGDIVAIARHFVQRFAMEYGTTPLVISPATVRALEERRWSGNVRELRNVIERAVLLAPGGTLDVADVAESGAAGSPRTGDLPFPSTLAELNRAAVARMLAMCGGNKTEAARRLGISRPRLHRLLSATLADREDDDADD